MKPTLIKLLPPLRLEELEDGKGYLVPSLQLGQPNLFTRIGFLGDIVVKIPSARGVSDFDKYVRRERSDPEDIRYNLELEKFDNLGQAIEHFPEFSITRSKFGNKVSHFLIVYRMQHARLQEAQIVQVPATRFIVLAWPRKLFGIHIVPAILQKRIKGLSLFDMVDPMEGVFLPEFLHLKALIRDQLAPLVESTLLNHIDWNIQNFVLEDETNCLIYVDSKPTTLAARWTTEHNLKGLRETFL